MSMLEVDRVTVSFGGSRALDAVSLDVETGTITGLIGPNGAGKTTLFNVVTGLVRPDDGNVRLDGSDVTSLAPHRRAHAGLSRTFQRLELFTSLTVAENVRVAGEIRDRWSLRQRRRSNIMAEVREVLTLVGLTDVADHDVATLPTGQARLVEVARALMARPQVLLLDEPASGQDEAETDAFATLLVRLRGQGVTVLLVEHDMSLVMSVSDRVHVLDFGRRIASGSPGEVQSDPAVVAAYLGADAT